MYLVQDAHEPIIPREQFKAVQAEMARRAAQHWSKEAPCAAHDLSGIIRCGICGAPYHHKIAGSAPKYKKPVWICATYNSLGKAYCASQMIPDRIMRIKLAEAGGPEGLREILVCGRVCPEETQQSTIVNCCMNGVHAAVHGVPACFPLYIQTGTLLTLRGRTHPAAKAGRRRCARRYGKEIYRGTKSWTRSMNEARKPAQ